MSSFLELPAELILKVFSYTETEDILRCGQVSKRIRTISNDNSLFQTVNLSNKIVKTDFLATLLNKGCKSFNLSDSALWGDLTVIPKSQLGILDLSSCRSIHVILILKIYNPNWIVCASAKLVLFQCWRVPQNYQNLQRNEAIFIEEPTKMTLHITGLPMKR